MGGGRVRVLHRPPQGRCPCPPGVGWVGLQGVQGRTEDELLLRRALLLLLLLARPPGSQRTQHESRLPTLPPHHRPQQPTLSRWRVMLTASTTVTTPSSITLGRRVGRTRLQRHAVRPCESLRGRHRRPRRGCQPHCSLSRRCSSRLLSSRLPRPIPPQPANVLRLLSDAPPAAHPSK